MEEEYEKVVTLENEVEAQLVDSILKEREIPHVTISYYDTAYDGLYQTQKGWGYISSPTAYHEQIQDIVYHVRRDSDLPDASS